MHKKKSVLALYQLVDKEKTSDERGKNLRELISNMLGYYKIFDKENGTQHHKIFSTLYMSKKDVPYYSIATRYNISTETLYRYINRYNKLAGKLIQNDG